MAVPTVYHDIDIPARKRSITENDSPTFAVCPSPKKVEFYIPAIPILSASVPRTPRRTIESSHRRRSSLEKSGRKAITRVPSMQAPNHSFATSMPTFMAVFEQDAARTSSDALSNSNDPPRPDSRKELHSPDTIFSPIDPPSFNPFHQSRHSISTSASESTDSSPTTTISLDSSSMTEPSPGPSPQSPTAVSFAMNESRFTPIEAKPINPTLPVIELHKPPTPAKKPRNLKNLAVNTSAAYNLGRGIATAPLQAQDNQNRVSAPASPAFVKPPTPPKRKLGKMSLTIMTPANSSLNNGAPQTPSITRPLTLRHFQSSPSLPLFTSGAGPAGGMTLPTNRAPAAPRGFAEVPMEEEDEDEPNYDVPQSREDKPESYPNGPIRIYESGVDLYYEPSVEVASRYDVIMNVASEVKNPFQVAEEAVRLAASLPQPSLNVGIIDKSQNAGSPTTPKATPITTEPPVDIFSNRPKLPEYIHIPWEHNTDIVPELHELVKVIDDRVKAGKTVLVHCQCGVSRSASLIVAYGMYTNPGLSVQEAYDAVKKRSKWIGPNMSLIMQLQEFRSGLIRNARRDHGYQDQVFTLPRKSSTITLATTDSFDTKTPSEPTTPRTAPYNGDGPGSPKRLNSSDLGPFSAGPVEPGTFSWDAAFRRSWGSRATSNDLSIPGTSFVNDTNYVDTKGHVVPVLTIVQNEPESQPKRKPMPKPVLKAPVFTKPLPFRRDFDTDTQMTDAPPLEPLMSPRSSEFQMTSLAPPPQVESHDTFNILSPMTQEFPKQSLSISPPVLSLITAPPPPPPSRAAPPPPPTRSIDISMEPIDSIFSPTSTSFPSFHKLQPFQPVENHLDSPPRQAERIDSLIPPISPPITLAELPKPNRLRNKFSAPNLSECRKLQRIQTEIANQLPQRPAEAEEALLSPRAENFVANPFHRLPGAITEEPPVTPNAQIQPDITMVEQSPESAGTPTSNASDPRSPAQFGISPITRNIWGMI